MATKRTPLAPIALLIGCAVLMSLLVAFVASGWFGKLLVVASLVVAITAAWSLQTKKGSWLKFATPRSAQVAGGIALGALVVGALLSPGFGSGQINQASSRTTVQDTSDAQTAEPSAANPTASATPTPSLTATASPTPTATPPAPVPFAAPADPAPVAAAPEEPAPVEAAPAPAEPSVYYKNCDAVRAAGAAPIYSGQPGYAKHLDRDGDGVGCEN